VNAKRASGGPRRVIASIYRDGSTPLLAASYNGYVEIVKLLLDKGADINAKSGDGYTALILASAYGHAKSGYIILNKNIFASPNRYTEIVKLLLDKGADINERDSDNATALLRASQNGLMEVVKLLLNKGADVNVRNINDATPLMVASTGGHTEIVKLLLVKGADLNVKTKIDGVDYTALKIAKKKGWKEIITILEKAGAKE
jgi:ankyrin repeat protein